MKRYLLLVIILLSGCNGGGDSGGESTTAEPETPVIKIEEEIDLTLSQRPIRIKDDQFFIKGELKQDSVVVYLNECATVLAKYFKEDIRQGIRWDVPSKNNLNTLFYKTKGICKELFSFEHDNKPPTLSEENGVTEFINTEKGGKNPIISLIGKREDFSDETEKVVIFVDSSKRGEGSVIEYLNEGILVNLFENTSNKLYIAVEDNLGNLSEKKLLGDYIHDNTAPEAPNISEETVLLTRSFINPFQLKATVADDASIVKLTLNNATSFLSIEDFKNELLTKGFYPIQVPDNQTSSIVISYIDEFENESESRELEYQHDSSRPEISFNTMTGVTNPFNIEEFTANQTSIFIDINVSVDTKEVKIYDTENDCINNKNFLIATREILVPITRVSNLTVGEGTSDFFGKAISGTGSESVCVPLGKYKLDREKPILLTSPTLTKGVGENNNLVTISGRVSRDANLIKVYENACENENLIIDINKPDLFDEVYSTQVALEDKNYLLKGIAVDFVGNVSQCFDLGNVVIDTTPPEPPVIIMPNKFADGTVIYTNQNAYTLELEEASDTIVLKKGPLGSTECDINGFTTVQENIQLNNSESSRIYGYTEDVFGNKSECVFLVTLKQLAAAANGSLDNPAVRDETAQELKNDIIITDTMLITIIDPNDKFKEEIERIKIYKRVNTVVQEEACLGNLFESVSMKDAVIDVTPTFQEIPRVYRFSTSVVYRNEFNRLTFELEDKAGNLRCINQTVNVLHDDKLPRSYAGVKDEQGPRLPEDYKVFVESVAVSGNDNKQYIEASLKMTTHLNDETCENTPQEEFSLTDEEYTFALIAGEDTPIEYNFGGAGREFSFTNLIEGELNDFYLRFEDKGGNLSCMKIGSFDHDDEGPTEVEIAFDSPTPSGKSTPGLFVSGVELDHLEIYTKLSDCQLRQSPRTEEVALQEPGTALPLFVDPVSVKTYYVVTYDEFDNTTKIGEEKKECQGPFVFEVAKPDGIDFVTEEGVERSLVNNTILFDSTRKINFRVYFNKESIKEPYVALPVIINDVEHNSFSQDGVLEYILPPQAPDKGILNLKIESITRKNELEEDVLIFPGYEISFSYDLKTPKGVWIAYGKDNDLIHGSGVMYGGENGEFKDFIQDIGISREIFNGDNTVRVYDKDSSCLDNSKIISGFDLDNFLVTNERKQYTKLFYNFNNGSDTTNFCGELITPLVKDIRVDVMTKFNGKVLFGGIFTTVTHTLTEPEKVVPSCNIRIDARENTPEVYLNDLEYSYTIRKEITPATEGSPEIIAQPAIPAVEADDTVDPPIIGSPFVPAVEGQPAVEPTPEIIDIFIEDERISFKLKHNKSSKLEYKIIGESENCTNLGLSSLGNNTGFIDENNTVLNTDLESTDRKICIRSHILPEISDFVEYTFEKPVIDPEASEEGAFTISFESSDSDDFLLVEGENGILPEISPPAPFVFRENLDFEALLDLTKIISEENPNDQLELDSVLFGHLDDLIFDEKWDMTSVRSCLKQNRPEWYYQCEGVDLIDEYIVSSNNDDPDFVKLRNSFICYRDILLDQEFFDGEGTVNLPANYLAPSLSLISYGENDTYNYVSDKSIDPKSITAPKKGLNINNKDVSALAPFEIEIKATYPGGVRSLDGNFVRGFSYSNGVNLYLAVRKEGNLSLLKLSKKDGHEIAEILSTNFILSSDIIKEDYSFDSNGTIYFSIENKIYKIESDTITDLSLSGSNLLNFKGIVYYLEGSNLMEINNLTPLDTGVSKISSGKNLYYRKGSDVLNLEKEILISGSEIRFDLGVVIVDDNTYSLEKESVSLINSGGADSKKLYVSGSNLKYDFFGNDNSFEGYFDGNDCLIDGGISELTGLYYVENNFYVLNNIGTNLYNFHKYNGCNSSPIESNIKINEESSSILHIY
jgi:hypothetical protein